MVRIFRATLVLLALAPTAPLAGAQDADRDAASGAQDTRSQDTEGQRGTASAPSGTAPAATPAAPRADDADAQPSPFDYEASEKISEDLSVSFPTDI